MGVPSRMENIKILQEQLGIGDAETFLDTEYRKNPMWAWKQTAKLVDSDATHLCIVQDDAILCNNFTEFCEYLVRRFPEEIFLLSNRNKFENTRKNGIIFQPGYCPGGICSIVPLKYIKDIIQLQEKKFPNHKDDDNFICYWAYHNNVKVLSTHPCVVTTFPNNSTLGHSGKKPTHFCKNPIEKKWANATTKPLFTTRPWDTPYLKNKQELRNELRDAFLQCRDYEWHPIVDISDYLSAVKACKCACTTLSWLCVEHKGAKHVKNPHIDAKGYVYHQKNRKLFMVYRDPVDRFVSYYWNKIVSRKEIFYPALQEYTEIHSIDELIDAIEKDFAQNEPYYQEQHTRKLVDFYPIEDVDIIVPIEYLDDFLKENGIIPPPHQNVSKKEKPILTQNQIERIKHLYEEDYELLNSPKLWKPKQKQSAQ